MDVRAGIFWDVREPRPPGFEAAVDGGGVGVPRVQAYPENRFYQQPRRQQELHGGWHGVAIPKPQRNNLPPLSVSVATHIVQDTARVTVMQLFWNNTNESIWKGSYTFPLSAGCTVSNFSCRIGRNKVVKAKVKSKPEARDAFNEALRTNKSVGLLEQGTPEIFTTTLGHIPANTRLRTEITYVTLLKHRFADNCNTITLTIPTNIAPRYGAPPPELQNTPIPGLSHGISIQVYVAAEETAHKISSKSHRVTIERGIGRNLYHWAEFATTDGTNDVEVSLVKLEDGTIFLEKDFVLDIAREQQRGMETPTAWLETHPTLANHKAVMLTIPPKFMLRNQPSNPDGEIIFLVDRSGSMSDKMKSLQSAMNFFLKGIPQGRKFNIWCFGSHYTSLWTQSLDYSEEALQEAMTYVSRKFSANMGGTELLGVLKAIVERRNQRLRMADIVILTDGEVWRLDETISFVQDTSRSSEGRIRFFALGIGNAVSHELVEGIAKAGGGYAEVIPAASQGGWEDRVVAMLGAALTGHVGHFQVEFDGQCEGHARGIDLQDGNRGQEATGPTRPGILQSPADMSTLSPFLRNRAFMLFDSARIQHPLNHINIKMTTPGGEEIITPVPISLLEREDSTIHKLGARALLGDLERGQSWIHLDPHAPPRGSTQEQTLVRQEGEALGCKWSLVSKWTSFYAVEERYHADENARVPFLDAEDIQIREAVGDLDLLRPRGAVAQQANLPAVPLPAAFAAVKADDGSDDDEDTSSNSDHMDIRSLGDGDSDSDDGGNGGDGGGAGGNQTDGSAGDQQRPEPDESNADGDGGATGGNSDTKNDATLPNASLFAAFDHGTRRSARGSLAAGFVHSAAAGDIIVCGETQSTPHEGADYTITYDSLLVPPLPLTMQSSGSLSTTPPNHSVMHPQSTRSGRGAEFIVRRTKRSRKYNSEFSHSEQTSTYYTSEDSDGGTQASVRHDGLETLRDIPQAPSRSHQSMYPASSTFRDGYSAPVSSMGSQPFPLGYSDHNNYSDFELTYSSPLAQSQIPAVIDPSSNMPASTAMRPNESRTSRSERRIAADLPRGPSRSYQSIMDSQPFALGYSNHNNYSDVELTNSSPPAQSQIPTVIPPSFNMPASTAMRPNESRTPRSEQEIAGEQKIRSLLAFQSFDGSFNFDSPEQLRTHLGPDFASVVEDLQLQVEFKLAVTAGLILLLEEKFEYCRDLWNLLYNKATDYFKIQLPLESERILLLTSARLKVHALGMSQILQLWEEGGAPVGNEVRTKRIVLDTAPIEDWDFLPKS